MKRILIMDDHRGKSALLKMTLSRRGYRVRRCDEWHALIEDVACADKPVLILVNQAFENGRGWDVFNDLKRIVPHTPILVYAMEKMQTPEAEWVARAVDEAVRELAGAGALRNPADDDPPPRAASLTPSAPGPLRVHGMQAVAARRLPWTFRRIPVPNARPTGS